MHAWIDALMHPPFWSLLPLSVFDWVVVVAVSVHGAMMPLNTPIYPVSVTSISLHAVFTGLSSFWLAPMSTIPDGEGLHHWKCIAAGVTPCHSHVAHIIYILTNIYIYIE